jgi:NAD-dependent dihydropyrimidine dehydrogenase PreA subunit
MAFVVTQPCRLEKNQACMEVCPVDCIYTGPEDEDRMVYINRDECIDCGACEAACPVTAIFEESAVPEEWSTYVEINDLWFEDRAAARALVDELESVGAG